MNRVCNATRWANRAVGTRLRFSIVCASYVILAVLEAGFSILLFENASHSLLPDDYFRGVLLLQFTAILGSSVVFPIRSLVALRTLLRERADGAACHNTRGRTGRDGEDLPGDRTD